jgi:hypothetical protein
LRETVAGGTRVRIDGAAACGPGGASAPYETTDRAEIASLLELLAVDEERSGGRCGCIGGPGIEVFQGERLLASVQLVCNRLLRWDGWPGDGELSEVPALFDWLAERGVTAPRDELLAERVALEAWAAKKRRATAGLSPRLLAAFQREDEVASHQPWLEERRWFAAALAAEFRGRPDRIRVLLRIFGAEESEADGYDWIDQLALDLLRKYPRRALEKACDAALLADDPQLRRGAARYRAAQPGGGG